MKPPASIEGIEGLKPYTPTPVVYFLCRDGAVMYVGQSVNITSRLQAHVPSKAFDSVYVLPCSAENLTTLETHWIETLRPPLNLARVQENANLKKRQVLAGKLAYNSAFLDASSRLRGRGKWGVGDEKLHKEMKAALPGAVSYAKTKYSVEEVIWPKHVPSEFRCDSSPALSPEPLPGCDQGVSA